MAHGLFKSSFEHDDTISSLIWSKNEIIMPTYRNAIGSTCGGRIPCRIFSYRQKNGCHLQTEPEFNERLSREKIRVFSSRIAFFRIYDISVLKIRQGTGWLTKVKNLTSNFKRSKSKKDIMYVILPWMVIEEENRKSKTEIEISMNE